MAPRPFFKGYLKLSLVTCPVAMTPAISESERIQFHTLNRETGNRVESAYTDAGTGTAVDEEHLAKGYQTGPDEFVVIEDEEFDSVALASTHTIDIDMFVSRDSIDVIWYDRPHYLVPDDPVGEEAFSVIRDAMAATGTAGISRLVLYRRERAVLLHPRGKGIVLWTLRYGEEVREAANYFSAIENAKPDSEPLSLITRLVEKRTKPWSAALAADPVQNQLKEIIAAKREGKHPRNQKKSAGPAGNVINIMDALRKSIASEKRSPKNR